MERFKQLVGESLAIVGQVSCHGIALELLPEPLDGIEVGAVGRKVERLDVVPVESGAFVPTGVVEHQMDLFAFFGRDLFGHPGCLASAKE